MSDATNQANPYLRSKVLTASPEELRLMLYDGAIKFCRQAGDAIGKGDWETMHNALIRGQKIVLEFNTSLKHELAPELCDKMAALYNYIYRRLVDANLERDVAAVNESIGLLEYERESWLMVMKKIKDGAPDAAAPTPAEAPNPVGRIGYDQQAPAPESPPRSLSVQG